ncbi:sensor histidine kinase [Wenjunlia tyrosinilytica]|uniref:Histidine kinase n=1 Tax=Wenjunlia tyrosinilytica TaxID=1544741 RepID=A0A917ZLQ2_9ACTN|nr:histidine kinase [Wenjunlia tyrosinilytica]GGO84812.1 histidine kinase [Wenjunlia tyrosinilytica]
MSRLTGWWDRRSDPARIELYTRGSFHSFALLELGLIGLTVGQGDLPEWLAAGLSALVALHALLCAMLSSRALDWALGRRDRPNRLFVAVVVLSGLGAVATLVARATGTISNAADVPAPVVVFTAFGLGALVLAIRGTRRMLCTVFGTAAGTAAVAAVLGLGDEALVIAVAVLLAGFGWVITSGCSAWLLSAVWELDAAREVQSQLAVAEERLRFGRDLHDVMGRNLAVIALKSELAVHLARRGRPEVVEQMIEIQRIAQESQREVREVVRGYRKADLAVELAGALSVLGAAGVDGRAEGDRGGSLPPQIQTALGWVIREATTNVLRHSEARRCTIHLALGASVVLTVENDGVPEPAGGSAERGTAGSGLAGLRERLDALGGTLAAESKAGVFRLTVGVPLPRDPGAAPAGSPVRSSPLAPPKGGDAVCEPSA